jgi:SAM-dependent methyltransferase
MITGDENFYSALQKNDWYYMTDKEEYQYVKQFIKKTDKVLDVGAGKGAFANLLSTKRYVGLDLSIGAKEMASSNGITILNETIQEHANKYPEEYDVVCSFQVLEHVSDPYMFIKSQLNTLKSGGLLILAVPSEDSFLKYAVNGILNMPPHHVTRWSDEALKKIGDLFNLILIDLQHEIVQDVHRRWYLQILIENSIMYMRLIDDRLIRKAMSAFSSCCAKILNKGLEQELLPYGHTVITIYRKP